MSAWLLLALAMTSSCALVLAGVVIWQRGRERRAGPEEQPEDASQTPDVIEYLIMMIGVVYAIVLGLAIAGVWEARDGATEWVRLEAQALHEVHERVEAYPDPVRDRVRSDVDAYVAYTVGTEWPRMNAQGELTERGDALFHRVRTGVAAFEPGTTLESHAYPGLVDQVAAADEARTARGQSAGSTMPGVVWFGLIAGALVVVGMVFALQIGRTARELLLAGLFSALIAFLLFLIWHFDAPYARGVADATEPFTTLLPQAFPR
ncbi:DUF4239 domain-containing protein [Streptomyces chumphonensis]|uniref:DUF4239 domain-containing protein n=1 Tax=Streptomyces chumphonensis TaxID=1214925 RepID=A0A927EXA1_9ACTN|nr:DUF4239 domain-containing protein [Streptomyces chumphonensis]MBD3931088.1 DUF4239 domain-containing protein [Streptomyces chumphonensis]